MMELEKLIRKNIRELQPYSCARDEYNGKSAIFLDANENPWETGYNRYPDPYQRELKQVLSELKEVPVENILLGNGSDEIIDLLIRTVCEPGKDNIVVFSPGYSMYEVSAGINDTEVRKINLTPDFLPDWEVLWKQTDRRTKIVFLCTPNNPTGKVIPYEQIATVCRDFPGLVLVDEAYIDFTEEPSAVQLLGCFPNVVVLQTLSKAWGMAGLRLGLCMADRAIIQVLNKVKAPYNVSSLTQTMVTGLLKQYKNFLIKVEVLKSERDKLQRALANLEIFEQVYESQANFILVISKECRKVYQYLTDHQLVVRLRDIPPLIAGGIRITVGTPEENERLLKVLKEYKGQ